MQKYYCFLFSFFFFLQISAQELKISLFNEHSIKSSIISVFNGKYQLILDSNKIQELDSTNILFVTFEGKKIRIYDKTRNLGLFSYIELKALTTNSKIKIKTINPVKPHQYYENNLIIQPDYNRLLILNLIELDKYIAGVVESECGIGRFFEFYKAHAVISRTYALRHIHKHIGEGFNLCDGTHCQAYNGKTTSMDIFSATNETTNQVLVYNDTALITSAFHSNCGGETQNCEDVWLISLPYLKTVTDPYCTSSRNARWEKTFAFADWKRYLSLENIYPESVPENDLLIKQVHRRAKFYVNSDSIALSTIRTHLGLKSTFFSMERLGTNVIFKGKGFGHGVGLCQEGAMEMAKQGFTYQQILQFYYKGIRIIDFQMLNRDDLNF